METVGRKYLMKLKRQHFLVLVATSTKKRDYLPCAKKMGGDWREREGMLLMADADSRQQEKQFNSCHNKISSCIRRGRVRKFTKLARGPDQEWILP